MIDPPPATVDPNDAAAPTGVPPPLLPLVTDEDWPAALVDLRDAFAGKLNVYRTMAHHPALLAAWAALRQHLIVDSALSAQAREIVTLRVGHVWSSRYEWAQHVVRGRDTGLSDSRIAACRLDRSASHEGDALETADVDDRLLIDAVDALLDAARLPPGLVDALTRALGIAGLFDLMATVGMYTTLAFVVNSFEVAVEPRMAAALAARPLSVA